MKRFACVLHSSALRNAVLFTTTARTRGEARKVAGRYATLAFPWANVTGVCGYRYLKVVEIGAVVL